MYSQKNTHNHINMECITIANSEAVPITEESQKLKSSDSAENFQQFIYELFEKNGILNDLRAYLRVHIVDVLKSAQTGEPPTCQKHFTQRLDVTNQALNMLVAEYLLRYEFSYSLSVFISEIPLANMVFSLAKTLMMQSDCGDHSELWFSNSDVWSILNYLGIKCDSVHATNIVEKYNSKESPLLLCILKSLPFYCRQDISHEQENPSMESLTSEKSSLSSRNKYTHHEKGYHEKCKHYAYCKACQGRLHRVKEKNMKKRKHLAKNFNIPESTQKVEKLVKNVSFAEKTFVDEMFHQLKSVYEAEVEMVKQEEEKKHKQVLAKCARQLQHRQAEMEEKFKQREEELEVAVQQKKKFLWGLAQALRDQHQHMAAAMCCVRGESERLTAKEDNLKTQLVDAENMIRNRGEEMRAQISNEILVLEQHLDSMRKERENIEKEKSELDRFKIMCDSKIKLIKDDSQFEMLKKEIAALKKSFEGKEVSVTDKFTMTDLDSGGKMNNQEVGAKSDSEERVGRTPNQVINDLKKQKNINFIQSHLDPMYQENGRARIRSQSTEGLEGRRAHDAILLLQDENDRLKHFARQQEQYIDELNMATARLTSELAAARLRPRTAPAPPTNYEYYEPRLSASISTYALAAGEDPITNEVPASAAPHTTDSKRYLIQQWRALRRGELATRRHSHPIPVGNSQSASHSVDTEPMRETADNTNYYTEPVDLEESAVQPFADAESDGKARCKSPKSMLKEAKLKLKNKVERSVSSKNNSNVKREKSPNSVLREAKLRLRKLEIEAEAVEKSYFDFRKRQTMREEAKCHYVHVDEAGSNHVTLDANIPNDDSSNLQKCKMDLDKFLNKYEKRFDIADSHARKSSPNSRAKVIPESYVELDKKNVKRKDTTYLETPLAEFRKLYSQNTPPSKLEQTKAKHTTDEYITSKQQGSQEKQDTKKANNKKEFKKNTKELQILQENINKIYNLEESQVITEEGNNDETNKNMLRIEIQRVTETNSVKLKECDAQDMFLVVQSPADAANISNSDLGEEISPRMTVLVSPKARNPPEDNEANVQKQLLNIPEHLDEPEKLDPDGLDTIFHSDKDAGAPQQLLDSGSDRDKAEDYVDDFSADVDNYNSRSDDGIVSPVSHIKTSEDENFWDS